MPTQLCGGRERGTEDDSQASNLGERRAVVPLAKTKYSGVAAGGGGVRNEPGFLNRCV